MTTPDQDDTFLVPPRRQRLIRIVGARRAPRAAYVSLAVSLGAALMLLGSWHMWRADAAQEIPFQRSLEEVTLNWKCPLGHRFKAPGHRGSVSCPTCTKPADIITRYTCGKHDPVEVAIRLGSRWSPSDDDRSVRLGEGPPVPAGEGLTCARCGLHLHSSGPDPLPAGRAKK